MGCDHCNLEEDIDPKDNHISFQCSNMNRVIRKLEEMNIEYVTAVVKEGGNIVDQLFFHDPDGYLVEICNCQNLPVLPLNSCPLKLVEPTRNNNILPFYSKRVTEMHCYGEAEELMMENFLLDMMTISIYRIP
ncbi:hypothetical protein I3843_09G213900 [Carya illinoinensis]|nr:hypothetical protein I3843_09G213900 [Carya illinoinensis]